MRRSASLALVFSLLAAGALAGCASPCCAPCRRECAPCEPDASANRWLAAARVHGRGSAAVWSYLASVYDADHDGRITAAEYPRDPKRFARLDKDGDKALTAADFQGPTRMDSYIAAFVWSRLARWESAGSPSEAKGLSKETDDDDLPDAAAVARVFARVDADHSGVVVEPELDRALADAKAHPIEGVLEFPAGVRPFPYLLDTMDDDKSGGLSLAEVAAWRDRTDAQAKEQAKAQAEAKAEADAKAKAKAKAEAEAEAKATPPTAGAGTEPPAPPAATAPPAPPARPKPPEIGAAAPDFTLKSPDGATTTTLSTFRGKKPVALIFGSYTCPPFRDSARWIRSTFDRHGRDVQFFFVYIREAHSIDGRAPMPSPDQPIVEDPTTLAERRAVAGACTLDLRFGVFDALVDDVDDAVARAYVAPPVRLYVIDKNGSVAYRSEPGPFGLDAAEFEAAVSAAAKGVTAAPPKP